MNKLDITVTLGVSCWSELIKTISPDHRGKKLGLDVCTFDEVLV